MEIGNIYEISGSGMEFQRMRLESIAMNLANAHSTRAEGGSLYKPVDVVATAGLLSYDATANSVIEGSLDNLTLKGVQNIEVVERNTAPRVVFDPGHPDADAEGYVRYPAVNPVDEMTELTMATRAYEANVRALNAAKTMALRALEIGKQ